MITVDGARGPRSTRWRSTALSTVALGALGAGTAAAAVTRIAGAR